MLFGIQISSLCKLREKKQKKTDASLLRSNQRWLCNMFFLLFFLLKGSRSHNANWLFGLFSAAAAAAGLATLATGCADSLLLLDFSPAVNPSVEDQTPSPLPCGTGASAACLRVLSRFCLPGDRNGCGGGDGCGRSLETESCD